MAENTETTNVVLTASADGYTSSMKEAATATDAVVVSINSLLTALDRTAQRAGRGLQIVSASTTAGITAATVAAARFESQVSSLEAVTASAGRSFAPLRDTINNIRRDYPLATEQVVSLATALQKMGQTQGVEKTAEALVKLSGATGEDLGSLTTGMIELQRSMGTSNAVIDRFANSVTSLSASMGTSATGILSFANSIAPMSRVVGMAQTEVLGISSAFSRAGQDGFAAANAFTRMLSDISRATRYGSTELATYANLVGRTQQEFSSLSAAQQMTEVFEAINKAGPDALRILEELGMGDPRTMRSIQGVAASGGLRQAIATATAGFGGTGALDRGAETAFEGFNDSLARLQNNVTSVAQSFGEKFLPPLTAVVDMVGSGVNQVARLTDRFAGLLAPLTAVVAGITALGGAGLTNLGGLSTAALAYMAMRNPITAGLRAGRGMPANMRTPWGRAQDDWSQGRGGPIGQWMFQRAERFSERNLPGYRGGVAGAAGRAGGFVRTNLGRLAAIPPMLWSGIMGMGAGGFDPMLVSNQLQERLRGVGWTRRTEGSAGALRDMRASWQALRSGEQAFSTAMRNATASTLRFGGAVASATAGAGMAVGGAAWDKMRATPLGRMAGNIGGAMAPMAAIAGISTIVDQIQQAGQFNDSLRELSGENSAINEYANAMGLATQATNSFAEALAQTEFQLRDRTPERASTVYSSDVTLATTSGRSLSNEQLSNMNPQQALAYLTTIFGRTSGADPQVMSAAKLDLIQLFGPEEAQRIMTAAAENTDVSALVGNLNVGNAVSPAAWFRGTQSMRDASANWVSTVQQQRSQIYDQFGAGEASAYARSAVTQGLLQFATADDPGVQMLASGIESLFGDNVKFGLSYFELRNLREVAQTGDADRTLDLFIQYASQTPEGRQALLRMGFTTPADMSQPLSKTMPGGATNPNLLGNTRPLIPKWSGQIGETPTGTYILPTSTRELLPTQYQPLLGSSLGMDLATNNNRQFRQALERSLDPNTQLGFAQTMVSAAGAGGPVGSLTPEDLVAATQSIREFTAAAEGSASAMQLAENASAVLAQKIESASMYFTRVEQAQLVAGQYTAARQNAFDNPSDPNAQQDLQEATANYEALRGQTYQYMVGIVRARRELDISLARSEENMNIGLARQAEAFGIGQSRSRADYELSRQRSDEDRLRSLQRGEDDYNRQRKYSMFDFYLAQRQQEEDYQTQRRRGDEDFRRQQREATQDYRLSRRRAEEDFNHQQVLMARQTSRQMQNIYAQMTVQPTWDASNLLVNANDQLARMQQQQTDLQQLRDAGISGDVISQLGLNEFANADQLARFAADIAQSPELVEQWNQAIKGRLSLAEAFATDEDNEAWKEMRRSFDLAATRGEEDFNRMMTRSTQAYKRGVDRMDEDYSKAVGRSEENFRRSLDRAEESYELNLTRMGEDYALMMERGATDYEKMTRRQNEDYARAVRQTRQDWQRQVDQALADFGRSYEEISGTWEEITIDALSALTGASKQQLTALLEALKQAERDIGTSAGNVVKSLKGAFTTTFGKSFTDDWFDKIYTSGGLARPGNHLAPRIGGWGYDPTGPTPPSQAYDRILATKQKDLDKSHGGETMLASGARANPIIGGGYRVTSPFSLSRRNPVTGRVEPHTGIDLAAPTGTGIATPEDGVVTLSGYFPGRGNMIRISHGNGWDTKYHHMSRRIADVGDIVKAGQKIGEVGSTGNSTGPHLHFELITNGTPINPASYLGGTSVVGGGKLSGLIEKQISAAEIFHKTVTDTNVRKIDSAASTNPWHQEGSTALQWGNAAVGKALAVDPNAIDLDTIKDMKWFAKGSIFNGSRIIGVGENGPEAVIPLNTVGADFMYSLLKKFASDPSMFTRGFNPGIPQTTVVQQHYDASTNVNGPVTVVSNDPNEFFRKIAEKKRQSNLVRPAGRAS